MTSSSSWSREDWNQFLDETAFLLYSMPALGAVRGKPGSWNEFGEKIAVMLIGVAESKRDWDVLGD